MSKINIELTQEEGMILFEFLNELDEKDIIKEKYNKRIAWYLIGMLEKNIDSIFNKDYKQKLEKVQKKYAKYLK